MSDPLDALAWPMERLGEVIEELSRRSGLRPRAVPAPRPAAGHLQDMESLDAWVEQAATYLGVEAEPLVLDYTTAASTLAELGPALLWVRAATQQAALALLGPGGMLLAPDRSLVRVAPTAIVERLCAPLEEPLRPMIEQLLDRAGVPEKRRGTARRALLREHLGPVVLDGLWVLRLSPGTPLRRQALWLGLPRRLGVVVVTQIASYLLWLTVWGVIGQTIFSDRLDRGYLLAGALLLATMVPLHQAAAWSSGMFLLGVSVLLKRRLLAGALSLDPEDVRHEGAGRFLSRVIESEAIEGLALGGALSAFASVFELLAAGAVLATGTGGVWHAGLLAVWVAAALTLGAGYLRRCRAWTEARLDMTHDLVERLVGHRTRLAQEPQDQWHRGEDEALRRYLEGSRALDRSRVALNALAPRGWLIAGIAGMLPAFVMGSGAPAAYAVTIGGVLLAGRSLQGLLGGVTSLSGASIAWQQVAPLYRSAARTDPRSPPPPGPARGSAEDRTQVLLHAHELQFRHRERARPVVQGASLRIGVGDRVLLEGPSGGGKSTLAALLSGLRAPESGLLLLEGQDRHVLAGRAWQRRVAAAPQFHENHVLSGTLAFNLLMGRRWPAHADDLAEAQAVCRELGLGELLDRMPSGLNQVVGETGWQLSHGERSRLFIARALLQRAQVVLLDESFAALDPETLQRAVRCVLARAPAVVVVAHP